MKREPRPDSAKSGPAAASDKRASLMVELDAVTALLGEQERPRRPNRSDSAARGRTKRKTGK
jgi:hypothetical protein